MNPLKFSDSVGVFCRTFDSILVDKQTKSSRVRKNSEDSDSDSNSDSSTSDTESDSSSSSSDLSNKKNTRKNMEKRNSVVKKETSGVSGYRRGSNPIPTKAILARPVLPRPSRMAIKSDSAASRRRYTPVPVFQRRSAFMKKNLNMNLKPIIETPNVNLEEELRLKAEKERINKLKNWFKETGSILSTDSIYSALNAMNFIGSTRSFVVSETGDLQGVVSLKEIASYLLSTEAEQKLYIRKEQEEQDGDYYTIDDL